MLTFYHYLLGGFMAVSCVTGALLTPSLQAMSYEQLEVSSLGRSLEQSNENSQEGTIDIAYRGSGRLDNSPEQSQKSAEVTRTETTANGDEGSFLMSHRGSGRIVPSTTPTRL